MMKITVLAVGKVHEKFYRDAIEEYSKRLSRYCRLEVIQEADEKIPEAASESEVQAVLAMEGERLLSRLDDNAVKVALAIDGRRLSSEQLAAAIGVWGLHGTSHIQFIIGGSLGLSPQVTARADFSLSFSDMTFPHQLMRVILLEQIYRSFRILRGEPYHK